MPYRWTEAPSDTDSPALHALIWPHKSMTPEGFAWFIGLTALLLALPVLTLIGSVALWVLLPFLAAALAGVWLGLRRNQHDLSLSEELLLSRDQISVIRRDPGQSIRSWQANPYWVKLRLYPDGKVENYLTLRGSEREIELGAFLSPDERAALFEDLERHLGQMRA